MKLYKYREGQGDYFERDILSIEKNYFWAAQIDKLNDPCEYLLDLDKLSKQENIFNFIIEDNPLEDVFDHLKQLISYCKGNGIYSLSETFKDELLWAHYGNSHKGFCIEYDFDILSKTNSFFFPVTYSPTPPKIELNDITKQADVLKKITSNKSKRWKYEKEFRIITDSFGKQSYDYKAVTAIYFGLKMKNSERETIMKRLKGRGIQYYEIQQIENTYKFKENRIKDIYSSNVDYMKKIAISSINNSNIDFEIIKSNIKNVAGIGDFDIRLKNEISDDELILLSKYLKENLFANAKVLFILYLIKSDNEEDRIWKNVNFKNDTFKIQG